MNDKKHYFSVKWTQPYPLYQQSFKELEDLRDSLIEKVIDAEDFEEANLVIDRIMKL
jgi:protein-arginine kinase activator protein McsA